MGTDEPDPDPEIDKAVPHSCAHPQPDDEYRKVQDIDWARRVQCLALLLGSLDPKTLTSAEHTAIDDLLQQLWSYFGQGPFT